MLQSLRYYSNVGSREELRNIDRKASEWGATCGFEMGRSTMALYFADEGFLTGAGFSILRMAELRLCEGSLKLRVQVSTQGSLCELFGSQVL